MYILWAPTQDRVLEQNLKKAKSGVHQLEEVLLQAVLKYKKLQPVVSNQVSKLDMCLRMRRFEEGCRTMSWEDLKQVASLECGIESEEAVIEAVSFLHQVGSLVHFHDRAGSELSQQVVLDPKYLVDAMSSIVSFVTQGWVRDGLVAISLLHHVWRQYSYTEREALLQILQRFEILHPLPTSRD